MNNHDIPLRIASRAHQTLASLYYKEKDLEKALREYEATLECLLKVDIKSDKETISEEYEKLLNPPLNSGWILGFKNNVQRELEFKRELTKKAVTAE